MRKFFITCLLISLFLSLTFSLYLLIFRRLEIYASIFFFFSILIYGLILIYTTNNNLINKNFSKRNKQIFKNILPPIITNKLREFFNFMGLKNVSKYSAFESLDEDFKYYLENSKVYGEYGMGISTKLAVNRNLIVFSVDTDLDWVLDCKSEVDSELVKLKWIDLGEVKNWGFPISYEKIKNIDYYLKFIWEQNLKPDLVLIDGRFRVACFLTCLKYSN